MCWSDLDHCLDLFFFFCLFTVEDSANLPPSPPPSPAAEHFGPLDQGRVMLHVCMERGEVRNTLKELENLFFPHEYSSHPLTLA